MNDHSHAATRALAECVVNIKYERIPLAAVHEVKRRTLDILGIALTASKTDSGRRLAQYAIQQNTPGRALLWGRKETTSPALATLANSSMIFNVELDDVHRTSHCHPAATTIPPALALADELDLGGMEVICAIIAGYEVENRVGNAVSPSIYLDRVFLPAATLGTLGAAAVTAKLYEFTAEHVLGALGAAAYLTPISLYENYKEGSSSKELCIGWASMTGINAANLARNGFEGPPSWLDGALGFAMAAADRYDLNRVVEGIGVEYQILKSGMKPYACCRQHHTAIDAALEIRDRHAPVVDDIDRIIHRTFRIASRGNNCHPVTVSAAKYSAPFSIATALIEGRAWRQDYTLEKIADEKTMGLTAKVEVKADSELEKLYDEKWPSIVEVYMKDGRSFQARRDLPKGEPEYPLSDEEVIKKFMDLACDAVTPQRAQEIYEVVWKLETLKNVRTLTRLLNLDEPDET
jgi:2-methylcitrate dehydratase PrpD